MATTVCLQLSTPKPHLSSSRSLELTLKPREPVPGNDGFSFLQTLSVMTKDKDEVYVHPLLKSRLNENSLRMCTELLGSETGSDNMVAGDENLFSMSSRYESECPRKEKRKKSDQKQSYNNFPPPLTTISTSECLKIKTRREDGRMVMEAVKGPSDRTHFRTQRSHGRLQLYVYPKMDHQQPKQAQRVESDDNKMDNMGNKQEKFKKEDEETEQGVEGEEESGNDANNIKVRGKLGKGDYRPMTSRCIEVGSCRGRFFGFGLNFKIESVAPS